MMTISASVARRLIKIALAFALLFGLAASQAPRVLGRIDRSKSPFVFHAIGQAAGQQEFFEKRIRPIFSNNCQRCHNSKAKVAGLDLTTADAFQRGGDSGPVVNKEKPEESRLLKVIS